MRTEFEYCDNLIQLQHVPQFATSSMENGMDYTYEDIAKMIDHSLLNPAMTDVELERGCREGVD